MARVDAKVNRKLDGLIELGVGERLDEGDTLFNGI
jgi:hypothetical protein